MKKTESLTRLNTLNILILNYVAKILEDFTVNCCFIPQMISGRVNQSEWLRRPRQHLQDYKTSTMRNCRISMYIARVIRQYARIPIRNRCRRRYRVMTWLGKIPCAWYYNTDRAESTYNPPLVSCVIERPVKTFSTLNVIAFRVLWPASASTCRVLERLPIYICCEKRWREILIMRLASNFRGVYPREFGDEMGIHSYRARVSFEFPISQGSITYSHTIPR